MPKVMFPVTEAELDKILAREGMREVAEQIRNTYFSVPSPGPVVPPENLLRPLRQGATLAGFTYSVPHDRLSHWQAMVEYWAEKGLPCIIWGHHYVQYNSTHRDKDSECCLVVPHVVGVWEIRYLDDTPQNQINTKSIWNALDQGVDAPSCLERMMLLEWWGEEKHYLPLEKISIPLQWDVQYLESMKQMNSRSLDELEWDQQVQFLVRANNIRHIHKEQGLSPELRSLANTCIDAFPDLFHSIVRANTEARKLDVSSLNTLPDYPLGGDDGLRYALYIYQEILALV